MELNCEELQMAHNTEWLGKKMADEVLINTKYCTWVKPFLTMHNSDGL